MNAKPVVPRARADQDFREAVDHYLQTAGDQVALRFVDAVEKAYWHIGRHPETGSLRFAFELELPELRCWPIRRFPYLIFYIEREDHIDVWRLLHSRRDIPRWLEAPESIVRRHVD